MGGFGDWVENVADSRNGFEYRERVKESETVSMWQSLGFGPNYKSAYCMAVCPAGEDVIGPYLASRSDFTEDVVRPLQARKEPVYVLRGSDAETHVTKRYPNKDVRHVRNSLHPRSIASLLQGMPLTFQRHAAGNLDATFHFVFTGSEQAEVTVIIRSGKLTLETGLQGKAKTSVIADAETWLKFLAGERSLLWALLTRRIRLHGNPKLLLAFQKSFPS
jgi:hypothetical protein